MSSIVYKQSYKARASPGVAGLNVRHLQYIATRPGTVFNKGCGFGLWGQLPGDDAIRIQSDLNLAKHVVRKASANHTLYRAIISVGKEDAEAYGLYHRERWEQLVNDRIDVIAKEMDIRPQNFCWLASMHCARGHPHVHILYWDSSDQPRPESCPKEAFKRKAENIRSAFAGDLYREEIRKAQQDQRSQIKTLRTALQAVCLEVNPEKTLDLPRLYNSAWLDGASKEMAELIRQLPAKSSLRYAYLPPDYKAMVDRFIDTCLEQPELSKEAQHYEALTQEISALYANGETTQAANLENARKKLYKELGNEIMDAIRDIQCQLRGDSPHDRVSAHRLIQEAVSQVTPTLAPYQQLRFLLPPERIPLYRMVDQIPGYNSLLNKTVGELMSDARIRLRLQRYSLEAAGIDLSQKPATPRHESKSAADKSAHVMEGKVLTEQEWTAYQDVYKEVKQELRNAITNQLRQEAGWTDEAIRSSTAMTLCGMMGLLSRLTSQRQAALSQASLRKSISKDSSKEARKDLRATQTFSSEWGD